MKIRIAPPKIPAFPASLVPNFLPRISPAKQMAKVTTPIIMEDKNAAKAL